MRRPSLILGGLLGTLTSIPFMALLYLGERFASLPFVPFDLFDWLARVLPGDVITAAIDGIVNIISILNLGSTSDAAKFIEQLMALGMVIGIGALVGALIAWALRRMPQEGWRIGAAGGLLLFILTFLVELNLGFLESPILSALWLSLLFVSWGALLGGWVNTEATNQTKTVNVSRRAALTKIAGGSFAVTIAALGAGRLP